MSVYYGAFELKAAYQGNLGRALFLAAGFHLLVIGGVLVYKATRIPDLLEKQVIVIDKTKPVPLPRFQRKMPTTKVEKPKVKPPAVGVLRAIPDEPVPFETELSTQETLEPHNGPTGEGITDSFAAGTALEEDPQPDSFIVADELPVLINKVNPSYPEIARIHKIEGKVTVAILVGTDGRVRDCRIRQSTNEIFNEEALAAVKQWAFKPAIQNKRPIKFWYNAPIVFKIE